ncbi:MAG: hypothetical protein WBL39_00390 [Terrimicrobiaceae bacterium]
MVAILKSRSTSLSWGDWAHFVAYTAKVNGFLPTALAQGLAILATVAELALCAVGVQEMDRKHDAA